MSVHPSDNSGSGRTPTFGEEAVGLTFNPSGRPDVDECKRAFASEIDRMVDITQSTLKPRQRAAAEAAIMFMQTAQMWAVKALTWKA